MKGFIKIIVLLLKICLNLSSTIKFNELESYSKVMSDTIDKIYLKNDIKFEIIIYGESSPLINKRIRKISGDFTAKVNHFSKTNLWDHIITESAIIFIKEFNSFEELIRNATLLNKFQAKLWYIVYIESEKDFSNFKRILRTWKNHYTLKYTRDMYLDYFSYFVIEQKCEIKLATIEFFTEELCNQAQIVTVDSFNKSSKSWSNKLKFQEKFKHFHDCMIVLKIEIDNDVVFKDPLSKKVIGVTPDISQVVAQKGNFSAYLQTHGDQTLADWSFDIVNGVELIPQVSVFVGIPLHYDAGLHLTTTFAEINFFFIVTPGDIFSNWEKVLLPFDNDTWMYLLITFGVAFFVVFLINRRPVKFQNLFYGEGVKYPGFNILGSFFGVSQFKLPSENFARILLIFFLFFCLIFRTAYQGKLFFNNFSLTAYMNIFRCPI